MTARRLALTNKKVRGIPRRLRSLARWAESWTGEFPSDLNPDDGYWNVKIPVLLTLIQGKQTSIEIQSFCAQQLIYAAHRVYLAKPDSSNAFRVTCCVTLPSMFSSEVCVFTSEEYFKEHTNNGRNRFGMLEKIQYKSLAKMWSLEIPKGFSEIGIMRTDEDENGHSCISEHWYFGEVSKNS
jgi:hypothetical protein